MRSIEEYLDQAPRFHALAALTTEPTLKKRYADLADCYRLLAADREKLIQNGTITANDNEP
jgi:hypothetical protein